MPENNENGGKASIPEPPPHIKELMKKIRVSLDPVIHDITGFLFNQLGIMSDGKIHIHLTVEDHQVVDCGYTVQGGFSYRKENSDAKKNSAV